MLAVLKPLAEKEEDNADAVDDDIDAGDDFSTLVASGAVCNNCQGTHSPAAELSRHQGKDDSSTAGYYNHRYIFW